MRMRLAATAAIALAAAAAASAGDPAVGEALAAPCAACHGPGGAEPIANNPIIAGQHEDYLLRSMLAYKDGSRNNAIMLSSLATLQESDLENLAAYYAAQPSPLR